MFRGARRGDKWRGRHSKCLERGREQAGHWLKKILVEEADGQLHFTAGRSRRLKPHRHVAGGSAV